MQKHALSRAARRAAESPRRVLFELGFERVSELAYPRGPVSLSSLRRAMKVGTLATVKVGGARCVTREAWKAFAEGTPDGGADVAGEAA